MAREVTRGDVRLFRFPKPDKERPVLVLTRSSALRFLNRVTVAPITTAVRDIPTEVILNEADGMRATCAISLDNVITVPLGGLGRRLTGIGPEKLAQVCRAIDFALGGDETAG